MQHTSYVKTLIEKKKVAMRRLQHQNKVEEAKAVVVEIEDMKSLLKFVQIKFICIYYLLFY